MDKGPFNAWRCAYTGHFTIDRQPPKHTSTRDGRAYDIPKGLIYSFPLRADGKGSYEIVPNVELSSFAKQKIAESTKELLSEREVVKDLLG